MRPALVVLAHGTGDAAGRNTWGRLLVRLRAALPGVEVRLAYAGVARPQLADVLPRMSGPVVVVPAFLAAGFHVRVDVPGQLAAIGRDDVTLAEPLGPDPALVDVALDRLRAAGWGERAGGAGGRGLDRPGGPGRPGHGRRASSRSGSGRRCRSGTSRAGRRRSRTWSPRRAGRSHWRRGCSRPARSTAGSPTRAPPWWPRRWGTTTGVVDVVLARYVRCALVSTNSRCIARDSAHRAHEAERHLAAYRAAAASSWSRVRAARASTPVPTG